MVPTERSFRELLAAPPAEPATGRGREHSSRGRAYRRLRQAIVLCQIPPGRAVSEQELADAFGVSRTPVREALQQLADEGLVVIRPQQGTEASRISPRRVREAQLIRELLERTALEVSGQRVGPSELEGLEEHLVAQERFARRNDFAGFFEADQRFHHDLAALSGFEGLGRLAGTARAHLDRVRGLSLPEPRTMQRLEAEHRAVVEHLRAGRPAAACEVLVAHLRGVLAVLPTMQERFAGYFAEDDVAGVVLTSLTVDAAPAAAAPVGGALTLPLG